MYKHALIGLFVFMGGVAQATPSMQALFSAIKATGTQIVLDHPEVCKDPGNLGNYTYIKDKLDRLTICSKNHDGDSAELYDTILHESIHVAQACKGGHLFTPVSIVKLAEPKDIVYVQGKYPQSQFTIEIEARVIAKDQDEVYVTELIKKNCK